MHTQSSIINRRSSMPRAFTIVEMLVVVMIAPVVFVSLSGLYWGFLRDVPQMTRLVEQNSTVLDMLHQLRRDMDAATGLPEQVGDRRADGATLLIEQADAVICYQLEEGRIVRAPLNAQGALSSAEERVWRARDAVLEWQPWMIEGKARGVEIRSYLNQRVAGETRRRFRSSQVFFVQNLAEGAQVQ